MGEYNTRTGSEKGVSTEELYVHVQLVASSRGFDLYSARENSTCTEIDTLTTIWITILILMARGVMAHNFATYTYMAP